MGSGNDADYTECRRQMITRSRWLVHSNCCEVRLVVAKRVPVRSSAFRAFRRQGDVCPHPLATAEVGNVSELQLTQPEGMSENRRIAERQ